MSSNVNNQTLTKLARKPVTLVEGIRTMDGGGVSLKRVIGQRQLSDIDPFLLLDEFKSDDPNDYIAGFPDHPHRGFETVTYMLAGSFEHRDHKGNRGVLSAGSVQWMTAGRGIIHSETPLQENGLVWGFQLWVNLPASHKMIPPRYQDIPPTQIPTVELRSADDSHRHVGSVKVIAGEFDKVRGPVEGIVTSPLYLDVIIDPSSNDVESYVKIPVPKGHNTFAYVYEGAARFSQAPADDQQLKTNASKYAPAGNLVLFEKTESVGDDKSDDDYILFKSEHGQTRSTRMIIVSGKPIGEPVARRGPFVMNNYEELAQAYEDFANGRLQE